MLERWETRIVDARLENDDKKPESYTEPSRSEAEDVATPSEVGGSVWSRLFPFLLVIMALTGAFYPAVDLCAGEKERGTMETLLISPASRSEIVMGKFLTVMLASVMTALLNLVSMGLTGHAAWPARSARWRRSPGRRAAGAAAATLAAPTLQAALWMLVLLIPLAAFFGAVCLALAVLARSMKEGQYYMTPLYLVSMPLIFLSLAPGDRAQPVLQPGPDHGGRAPAAGPDPGQLRRRLPLLPARPAADAGLCGGGACAGRSTSSSARMSCSARPSVSASRTWVRHLFRDREPTPTAGEAVLCFALMLASSWFLTDVPGDEPEGGFEARGPWRPVSSSS